MAGQRRPSRGRWRRRHGRRRTAELGRGRAAGVGQPARAVRVLPQAGVALIVRIVLVMRSVRAACQRRRRSAVQRQLAQDVVIARQAVPDRGEVRVAVGLDAFECEVGDAAAALAQLGPSGSASQPPLGEQFLRRLRQHLAGDLGGDEFQMAAADGVGKAVRRHQHLCAGLARHRAFGARNRHQDRGRALFQQGVEPVVHGSSPGPRRAPHRPHRGSLRWWPARAAAG